MGIYKYILIYIYIYIYRCDPRRLGEARQLKAIEDMTHLFFKAVCQGGERGERHHGPWFETRGALVLRLESWPRTETATLSLALGSGPLCGRFPCNPASAAPCRTKADGSLGGEAFCAPGSVRPNTTRTIYVLIYRPGFGEEGHI